ncbi:hypothetical protein DV738_g2975, partial [Chaetothyriales sp. CBS 135597]
MATTDDSLETYTHLPIHIDPASKALSVSSSDQAVQDAVAQVNALHTAFKKLETANNLPPPPMPPDPKRSAQIQKLRESAAIAARKANHGEAIRLLTFALDMAASRPGWEPSGLAREELAMCYLGRAAANMESRNWVEGWKDAECSTECKRGPQTTPQGQKVPGNPQAFISEAVALYISSLADEISHRPLPAASDTLLLPDFVTGVRRKYLVALQANVLARQAFADKASSQGIAVAPRAPDYGDAIIRDRLSFSRQQQQHESLDTLSRHVTAFERLLPSSHPRAKQHESTSTVSATPEEVKHSQSQSRVLLRKLELAVFDARMRAESGRLSPSATHSAIRGGSVTSRLRGLRAVHRELTSWLEESLGACAQYEPPSVSVADQEHDQNYQDDELQAAYSRYILGRKNMAAAVDALSQPLPDTVQERNKEEAMAIGIPKADQAKTVQKSVRLWQEKQQSQLLADYTHCELEKESEEAAAILDRLADESQLLPAYPRLVKHGAGVPSDRVRTRIEAWTFASEAADACASTAIDRDIADGQRAIDETMKTLLDLTLLQESALAGP